MEQENTRQITNDDFELRAWNDWGASAGSTNKVTPETALQVSAFLACIRVIAESCSSLPLFLYRRLPGGGKEKALDQPLNRLLHQQPNPWQTAMEWREMQTTLMLMYGNSFSEIRPGVNGAVSELWPLHPSRMIVDRVADGSLRYRYKEPAGSTTTYSQDQIFHLRWLSTDGVLGMQPSSLSRNAIALAQALEIHGSKFFENGARPGGILESDNPIPLEASANLRQQFEGIHRGADRSHKIALLPAGVHYKEIGGANESAQFLQSRAFQVVEMCRIFRMPPHMVQHLDKSTFSNIQTQSTEFVQYCLLPHLKRWESAISRDLISDDETYFAEHSVSGLMRGDSTERASYYRELLGLGVMTINECRDLENLNPIGPAGDHRLMQMNLTTLENIIVTPAPAPAPVAAGRSIEKRSQVISIDFDRTYLSNPTMWGAFAASSVAAGNTVVMITRRKDTAENKLFISDVIGKYAKEFSKILLIGPDALKSEAAKAAGISVDVWIDDTPKTIG